MKLEEREGEERTVALGKKKGITENGRRINHVVGCEISVWTTLWTCNKMTYLNLFYVWLINYNLYFKKIY